MSNTLIPTRDQCLSLMEQVHMPAHIRRHSLQVAEIAVYLGERLNQNSIRLNLPLLEAGALLHDLGKEHGIITGESHADVGGRMVREQGYPLLSPIVEEHVSLDWPRLLGPVTESLVVNYADKRVKHDEIVSLEERFDDLGTRYARTEEHKAILRNRLKLYLILEEKIFGHLTVIPADVGSLGLP